MKFFTITKANNHVVNLQKLTCNNPNKHLVKVNAYARFSVFPAIRSQGIERKQNSDDNLQKITVLKISKI